MERLKQIYTTKEDALNALALRWKDESLKREIENFIGPVPEILKEEPRAVLLRYIATPNVEMFSFLKLAKTISLKPLYCEFLGDKFCTWNKDKLALAKMTFFSKDADDTSLSRRRIVDLEKSDSMPFEEMKTLWGENFVDFHHGLLDAELDTFNAYDIKKRVVDTVEYYVKWFSIFLAYGIMFENFILKENHYESRFTNEVVIPAFQIVEEKFKLKPLIVPIFPLEDEDLSWTWYNKEIEKKIQKKIQSTNINVSH